MEFLLPELEVNMVVTTPYKTLPHITPNKKYIICKIQTDNIWLKNDYGQVAPYKGMHFIEVDVYYALCLYLTIMRTLNLSNYSLDTLDN